MVISIVSSPVGTAMVVLAGVGGGVEMISVIGSRVVAFTDITDGVVAFAVVGGRVVFLIGGWVLWGVVLLVVVGGVVGGAR